jgi:hypothetical protein
MKIYGFWNHQERWPASRCGEAVAISENGDFIGSHICSGEGYAEGDLSLHEECQDGEFIYVPFDERGTHAGLQEAFRLNRQMREEGE